MSFVITNPEALTVAATEVRRIRDRAIQSDAQVAPMTTAVRPPAADLVSEKAATFLVEYARSVPTGGQLRQHICRPRS